MSFETQDGKEHLPDEEDIYGVNDIEEKERFETLFGGFLPQDERIRRRKARIRLVAIVVIATFALAFALAGLRFALGW
jgi:hypothetical protein